MLKSFGHGLGDLPQETRAAHRDTVPPQNSRSAEAGEPPPQLAQPATALRGNSFSMNHARC
ncbi:MAG: hypothetical protein CBC48_03030 [bacterium TMED88]|nr:hypothetical protein [Deltaproteobacteria bacterium]OUV35903.1 MAG: hypothetical protein CBC48_03030 [bacterium TMED88]